MKGFPAKEGQDQMFFVEDGFEKGETCGGHPLRSVSLQPREEMVANCDDRSI